MWAKLTISSAHSRAGVDERRLLVPTWSTISSGFFRKIGLMWSLMSWVEHPGKEEILTLALLDIFLPCKFFRMESPTKNTSLCLRWVLRPPPEFPFVRSVFNWHDDDVFDCECLPSWFDSVEGWFCWSPVFFFFPTKTKSWVSWYSVSTRELSGYMANELWYKSLETIWSASFNESLSSRIAFNSFCSSV